MDSNFQVKITADISNLQASIKSAQSTLNSLKATSESASGSFNTMGQSANRVGADMNRARLATFAFGQVIRDAGFFSQSFGLGVLAISNNIPILIDQLVLLSGVSAGLGAALSVVGSALAAGLTVFAYWAQSVEREGGTVSGAINKMANDSESSIGKLVKYLNTPPASEMLGKAVNGVQEGIEAIKKIIDAGIKLAIALWERFGPAVLAALDKFFAMAKNVMLISLNILRLAAAVVQGDWTGALNAIGNIGKSVFNNLIELAQAYIGIITKGLGAVIKIYDPLKGTMLQVAGEQVVKLGDSFKFATEDLAGFNFDLLKLINNLFSAFDATGKAKESTETYASVIAKLRDELQQLDYTFTGTFGDKQEGRIKALQTAIEGLRKIGFSKTSKEVKTLSDELSSLANQQTALNTSKNPLKTAGVTSTTGGLAGAGALITDEDLQKANAAFGQLTHLWNVLYGAINTAKEAQDQFDESMTKFAEGAVRVIGGELTNAFTVMLETGTLSFKGIFQALGQMVKRLLAAVLAASLLSAILSSFGIGIGKAKKGDFGGNIAEIMKFMTGATFAKGGIVSGPTLGLMGEYPGARSNPEVIAPLDKLQSILGTSGSSQVGAVIAETRVSGNDLAILIKRADRNRNGNY